MLAYEAVRLEAGDRVTNPAGIAFIVTNIGRGGNVYLSEESGRLTGPTRMHATEFAKWKKASAA